jgi:hypothetical protein
LIYYTAAGGKRTAVLGAPDGSSVRLLTVGYGVGMWQIQRAPLKGSPNAAAASLASLEAETYRALIANGVDVIVGTQAIDGRKALHVRRTETFPAPSTSTGRPPKGASLPKALSHKAVVVIDTWLDPVTYLPIRERSALNIGTTVTDTETWLPRTPANLARFNLTVPSDFAQNSAATSSQGAASWRSLETPSKCPA